MLKYLRLILISGPPRSGKNRAGTCLSETYGGDHFALSDYLKSRTHMHYGLGEDIPIFHFEARKDQPCPEFSGKTPREAYIDYSERILKPKYGNGYLGEIAAGRVAGNAREGKVSIVSGVGFFDEVKPLIRAAGSDSTVHIVLDYLQGKEVSIADSREHLDLNAASVCTIRLTNSGCAGFVRDFKAELEVLPGNGIPDK